MTPVGFGRHSLAILGLAVSFSSKSAPAMAVDSPITRPALTAEDLHIFVGSFVAKQLASSAIPGAVVVIGGPLSPNT